MTVAVGGTKGGVGELSGVGVLVGVRYCAVAVGGLVGNADGVPLAIGEGVLGASVFIGTIVGDPVGATDGVIVGGATTSAIEIDNSDGAATGVDELV